MGPRRTWYTLTGLAMAFAIAAPVAAQQDSAKTAPPVVPAPAADTVADTVADSAAATAKLAAAEPLDSNRVVVDRVVGVVGNRPILASQVDEQLFTLISQQGMAPPKTAADTTAIRHRIVQDIIDDELLVQEAQRDTAIKVTDQEVADAVEQMIRNIRGKFGTEPQYRDELRKAGFQTPDEYRRWLTDQNRRQFLRNRLLESLKQSGKLKTVQPTDREMREYFEAQRAQLGKRPPTVSFRQIVVSPKASPQAKARARAIADSILVELRKGADFAVAAKRLSQDPGSKEQGGELGWLRRGGQLDPVFERVAFSLKPGVVSEPVESAFGFHLIQVERAQPAEIQVRHILIMPEITVPEVDSARGVATQLAEAVKKGASFDSLQRLYHDPSVEREATEAQISRLPPPYVKGIGDAAAKTVVPVFALDGATETSTKFVVLQVTARRAEGEIAYEDVREQIRGRLAEQLTVRRYVERLRRGAFVEVRTS